MIRTGFTPQALRLMAYTPLQYMLRAMATGSAPAQCYADREDAPSACLILEDHSLFAGGDARGPAAEEAVAFLTRALLTKERRRELGAVRIAFPDNAWKERLEGAFSNADVHTYPRKVLRHPAPGCGPRLGEAGLLPVTADMERFENFGMIREEVESTTGSLERFLSMGFGVALVLESRVCGFCTAEYVSEKECAIGIAVEKECRGQGHAKRMTARFLKECAKRGLTPYWECWKNNLPSVRTAEGAGFEALAEYPVLLAEFS